MDTPQFYTLKGYEREKGDFVTAAMEDYLEMICRLSGEGDGPVRIRALSRSEERRVGKECSPTVRWRGGGG